jgi:alanyl-tRNA synthetase
VARTGDIALFKIVSEGGVAAGIRRIEALSGEAARRYLLDQAGVARQLAEQFKVQPLDVPARVEALITERKSLERALSDAKRQLAVGGGSGGAAQVEEIAGIKFIGRVLEGVGGKELRPVAEDFKKQIPDRALSPWSGRPMARPPSPWRSPPTWSAASTPRTWPAPV